MKLSYLLGFFLTILSIAPQYAQQSEKEKILAEATKNRFNDPEKSLKLYGFLAKNSTAEEAVIIQLKQLQLYRLLGKYDEAVAIFSSLRKTNTNHLNSALQLEYWLESAHLFVDLDLKNEGQKFYQNAEERYRKLSVEVQRKYAPDIQLLAIKLDKSKGNDRKVSALKDVLRKLKVNDERAPFIQFNIAKLYFASQKDSAANYFRPLISAQKSTPLSQNSNMYLNLLESNKMDGQTVSIISTHPIFDQELKPLLLKNAIIHYANHWDRDRLMYYHRTLYRETLETQLKKRVAKVALIQNNYQQQQVDAAAETVSQHRKLFLAISVLTLLLITYFGYKVFIKKPQQKLSEIDQAKGIIIPDKTEVEILEKLREFEKSELFLDPQIRLAGLAKKLDTNTRYLSSIINTSKAKSFNGYVNSLRIDFILDKLNSEPRYRTYKISYLAHESGFVSQSSFTTAFKEVTGYTPSTYIKNIKTKKNPSNEKD